MDGQFSLAALRDLLRMVVSLDEHDLTLADHMPLPGQSIIEIHQAVRRFAEHLVQRAHRQEGPSLTLEKPGRPQLRLTIFFRDQGIECVKLGVGKGTSASETRPPLEVGFLTISYHGVEALFGFENFLGAAQEQGISSLSRHNTLTDRYRRLWRALRWLCANLLVWEDTERYFLPEDLDRVC